MKNIYEKFHKSVCTSEFDLSNNDFNENWINGFFKKTIFQSVILNNTIPLDLYINFEIFQFPNQIKNTVFYKNLHLKIKEQVYGIWSSFNIKNKPIYYTIDISNDNQVQFLVLFISPVSEKKHLAFSQIKQQNKIISNLLSLLLNINFLGTLNNKDNIWDVNNGCLYINPQINKNMTKFFGYQIVFHYSNNKLKFFLKGQSFKLDNSNMNLYEDICLISKDKIYSNKINPSIEFQTSFLNLIQNKHTLRSKFMSQYIVYKKLRMLFKNNFIHYQETFFTPTKLFNNFYEEKTDSNIPLNIFIDKNEKDLFNKACLELHIPDGFDLFIQKFKEHFHGKVNVLLATNNNFKERECGNNIYLMFGDKYDNHYVHHKINPKMNEKTAFDYYLNNNLSTLSFEDIEEHLKNIDLYSSIKIRNLLHLEKKSAKKYVTQGLILDPSIIKNDKLLKNIILKILGELTMKRRFFKEKQINLNSKIQHNFTILETYLKTIKKINKKTYIYYSYIKFQKDNKYLSIIDSQIMPEHEFKNQNLSFPDTFLENNETLMVFDNKFILHIKDNNLNPRLIFRKDLMDSPTHDPILKIKNQKISNINNAMAAQKQGENSAYINRLLETPVKFRRTDINENILFPYFLPTSFILTGDKEDQGKFSSILIDDTNETLKVFYHIANSGMSGVSPKDSLIEEISLYQIIDEFEYRQIDCKQHLDLIEFYLSMSTFKLLLINSVSKKTILRKFLDISLFN